MSAGSVLKCPGRDVAYICHIALLVLGIGVAVPGKSCMQIGWSQVSICTVLFERWVYLGQLEISQDDMHCETYIVWRIITGHDYICCSVCYDCNCHLMSWK